MSITNLPVALNNVLVKLKIGKPTSAKKYSLNSLNNRAESLYFDVLPSAWNVKEKEYPFQCYSMRAAKMCIDLIEDYGTYDFLDDVDDACRRWMRLRQRDISIGYKFLNPYSAFLVFLVELCVRLKKLKRKSKKKTQYADPPERKFQKLMLTCLGSCFEMPLLKNTTHITYAVKILKKISADGSDMKMDAVISFMDTHEVYNVNDDVATFFRIQIRAALNNFEIIDKKVRKSKK